MSSKFKRKGKSKFIMIEAYVKRCAAWKVLTPIERNAYLEVKWRYDGHNNGRIALGCRELAEEIGMGRDTAKRALTRLSEVGFISKVRASAFTMKNRAVTEWRLTEYKCDVTGDLSSKEFMRWQPTEKQQAHPSDTQAHPCDTPLPKMGDFIGHRRTHAPVRPISPPPQAHPSDTYRYTIPCETESEAVQVGELAQRLTKSEASKLSGRRSPAPIPTSEGDFGPWLKSNIPDPKKHREALQLLRDHKMTPEALRRLAA